ncbi:MAG: hypothetical protein JNJ85_14310 [Candidatus Kapabacteria bacterium]|nr:hypothetical protein [Candidatus Kapabacteria bacterium]
MNIEHQVLSEIKYPQLDHDESITIRNVVIDKLEIYPTFINREVIIENCVVNNLVLMSRWFKGGLKFSNNIVLGDVYYEYGGHNELPFVITNNIFKGCVHILDCQFHDIVVFEGNIFLKGCNLLGNQDANIRNTFEKGYEINNNIGRIDLDGCLP